MTSFWTQPYLQASSYIHPLSQLTTVRGRVTDILLFIGMLLGIELGWFLYRVVFAGFEYASVSPETPIDVCTRDARCCDYIAKGYQTLVLRFDEELSFGYLLAVYMLLWHYVGGWSRLEIIFVFLLGVAWMTCVGFINRLLKLLTPNVLWVVLFCTGATFSVVRDIREWITARYKLLFQKKGRTFKVRF